MPKAILGIDPGLDGALALYRPSADSLEVVDVPLLQLTSKRLIDEYALARVIDNWAADVGEVWLELVGVRPGEGAVGAFTFGRGYWGLSAGTAASFADRYGLAKFAMGGSIVVGGRSGVDQNVLSINGTPAAKVGRGERITVSPNSAGSDSSQVVAAINRLGDRLEQMERQSEKTLNLLNQVYEGGAVTQRTLVEAMSG